VGDSLLFERKREREPESVPGHRVASCVSASGVSVV